MPGTTRLDDRHDPMLGLRLDAVLAAAGALAGELRRASRLCGKTLVVEPNGVNAIPSRVRGWLDARGADEGAVRARWSPNCRSNGGRRRRHASARSPGLRRYPRSTPPLSDRLRTAPCGRTRTRLPVLATGAGHDAGILATAGIPTAMIFVRNPTGVSHSPAEFAERADCLRGVEALTTVVDQTGSSRNAPP